MSKTIWKYELDLNNSLGDIQDIECPRDAVFIHVGMEPSIPSYALDGNRATQLRCWALVDPTAPKEKRMLLVVGTGHPVPENAKYIGSVVAPPYAWHVFEMLLEI